MLTVYSGPNCTRCIEVKDYLALKGIQYNEVNIRQDDAARQWLVDQGFRGIPQVFDNDVHVCGWENYKEKL